MRAQLYEASLTLRGACQTGAAHRSARKRQSPAVQARLLAIAAKSATHSRDRAMWLLAIRDGHLINTQECR